jgi:sulfur carrier protein ThiS
MATEKVKVTLGQLTKPFITVRVNAGTTLADFLAKREMTYSSAVRINGKTTRKNAVLRTDDVVTVIEDVDGGLA